MKSIFITLFTFTFGLVFSQKHVDAIIVKTSNDTISSRMKISTNIFNKKLINESSFYKTVTLVDENGNKKEKIKAIDIKELKFVDLEQKNMLYVNNGKALKRVVYNGKKIKWYWDIHQNIYDGSIQYKEYLVDENGVKYNLGLFNSVKSTFLEITKSKPELAAEIENTKFSYDNFIRILEKYENE